MNIRYANDILLTELARQITNELSSMNEYLRDGNLDGAWLRAHTMGSQIESLKERLNVIKYERKQ